ncbi:hypothetical protein GTY65_23120 [Streptomyces sp. SID8379]|uniref:hypothetical protein n=1 Tax=unclassified Streptomyces TaxID=2593676 RepID=UPI00036B029C|nr:MULTISPECIES: hypothetical protein [unclassified Streptomyces]MYW66937.1 hypothetical protein [Streptomyces sp. SID8379]
MTSPDGPPPRPRAAARPADYDYGAAHAYELPYLFPRLTDADGIPYARQMTSAQRKSAHTIRAAWGDFLPARTGRTSWRPLNNSDSCLALRPGASRAEPVSTYHRAHHCDLWDRLWDRILP